MKRFVDIRTSLVGERFAWWDTCCDSFEKYKGNQAWSSWNEFESDYDGDDIQRYKGLCPAWVFDPSDDE